MEVFQDWVQLPSLTISKSMKKNHFIFSSYYLSRLMVGLVLMLFAQNVLAEEKSIFNTESIRSQLFNRMKDRKEGQKARKINLTILQGVFGRMTDPESIWVRIDSRTEFRKWTYKLSKQSLNLPRQEVRVWLKYVSPSQSVSFGKEYNTWFKKKVVFEMSKIFYNRNVRVDYDYSEKLYRLQGVIRSGDTNLNLWMIRNGWSYYLLPDEKPEEHEELIAAEKEAREKQVGLWKEELQQ